MSRHQILYDWEASSPLLYPAFHWYLWDISHSGFIFVSFSLVLVIFLGGICWKMP